jgi:hypothetical protein
MKIAVIVTLFCVFLVTPVQLNAQQKSLQLICPLNKALVLHSPSNFIQFDKQDFSVTITSNQDTVVKACFDGQITNIETDENGKYQVVLFAKINKNEYYLWYSGMYSSNISKTEHVKAGYPIAFIHPGDKIDLSFYRFETPLDLALYLDCRE